MNKWIAAVLLFLPACHKDADAPKTPQPGPSSAAERKPRVRLQEIARKKVSYVIEASGALEAAEEIKIPARVAGVVDEAGFTEGDRVTRKTVLVKINLTRYTLAEQRAKADFDRAHAQKVLAEKLYQNRLSLYEEGKKRQKDWMSEEQLAMALADKQKAIADLKAAEVEWNLAKHNLSDATVRPPISGVIQTKLVSRGEYVKPETVVATMLNISTLYVRFTLPELEASKVKMKQLIRFTVQSVPDEEFTAELFYMSQQAEASTRAVECKAEVRNPTDLLRPGYFASVRIVADDPNKTDSLLVPERAVLPSKRGFLVFLADDQNKVMSREVTLGLRVDGDVEILKGLEDLKPYHRIAVDGAAALRDGVEIDPVTEEKK